MLHCKVLKAFIFVLCSVSITSPSQLPATTNSIENNSILNQSGQSPFLSQFQQKATETIKSVVGMGNTTNSTGASLPNSHSSSGYSVGQNLNYRQGIVSGQSLSSAQKYPNAVSQQQRLPTTQPTQSQLTSRAKPQRTRLPPPSKVRS